MVSSVMASSAAIDDYIVLFIEIFVIID